MSGREQITINFSFISLTSLWKTFVPLYWVFSIVQVVAITARNKKYILWLEDQMYTAGWAITSTCSPGSAQQLPAQPRLWLWWWGSRQIINTNITQITRQAVPWILCATIFWNYPIRTWNCIMVSAQVYINPAYREHGFDNDIITICWRVWCWFTIQAVGYIFLLLAIYLF